MHNGFIADFARLRRDLLMAVDPTIFSGIEGATDSEAMFYLALTFGLQEEPVRAVQRAVGLVEDVAERHGVPDPVQMTVATTDGALGVVLPLLDARAGPVALLLHRDHRPPRAPPRAGARCRASATRPGWSSPSRCATSPGAWNEVPESSWGVVRPGADDLQPFTPERHVVAV